MSTTLRLFNPDGAVRSHVPVNALKQKRAELRNKAQALCDAAIKSGKDLQGAELEQYNAHVAEIKHITNTLDRHAELATFSPEDEAPSRPFLAGRENFDAAPAHTTRERAVSTVLSEVYARGNVEQREQIEALAGYLSGRNIRAAADLTPGGDGGVVIPSFVQFALERNYAAFAPVVSVARLFPNGNRC